MRERVSQRPRSLLLCSGMLVGVSLLALSNCKAEEEAQSYTAVAAQAQAAQAAIANAKQEHEAHVRGGMPAMPMADDDAMMASPPAASATTPPGMPEMASDRARLLGQPPSTAKIDLPPAVGAPHLYHFGAQTFFLEQSGAITLTPNQEAQLTAIKASADAAYAETQRTLDAAENVLWTLTSLEKPDGKKIDAKIKEIGRLGAQQRMDYVRAIGTAVAVLDEAQQKAAIALAPTASPTQPPNMAAGAGGRALGEGEMEGTKEMAAEMKESGGKMKDMGAKMKKSSPPMGGDQKAAPMPPMGMGMGMGMENEMMPMAPMAATPDAGPPAPMGGM